MTEFKGLVPPVGTRRETGSPVGVIRPENERAQCSSCLVETHMDLLTAVVGRTSAGTASLLYCRGCIETHGRNYVKVTKA